MLTDQPIRFVAVFILAPILLYRGFVHTDYFIILFAISLFIWDLYCILYKAPVQLDNILDKSKNVPHDICL